MEKYFLEDDIKLICVPAKSFPDGVMEAFERLAKKTSSKNGRNLFGISYPGKDGKIIYKAAANKLFDGEAEELRCESFTVKKGNYNAIFISDFMNNISDISKAFNEILKDPLIDPNGCCVEMYLNEKDVRCMVRLDPVKFIEEE
ncbi:MAG: transcriptional regulator [Bacteroidetes bacterium]|nr:transcriptional regulator [Bacteroidota bacterium]